MGGMLVEHEEFITKSTGPALSVKGDRGALGVPNTLVLFWQGGALWLMHLNSYLFTCYLH